MLHILRTPSGCRARNSLSSAFNSGLFLRTAHAISAPERTWICG